MPGLEACVVAGLATGSPFRSGAFGVAGAELVRSPSRFISALEACEAAVLCAGFAGSPIRRRFGGRCDGLHA